MITTLKELIGDQLDNIQDPQPELPIYHTTNFYDFTYHILQPKKLAPHPDGCQFYDRKKILYFFYGKAEYWPNREQRASYGIHDPVTVGYSISSLRNFFNPRKILPFDSGGYFNGRYLNGQISPIENFEFPPNFESIGRFVSLFFTSTISYIEAELNLSFEVDTYPLCLAAHDIKKLHDTVDHSIDDANFGEQAYTIELQFEDAVFDVDFEVIFLPEYKFRANTSIDKFKREFPNCEIELYECRRKFTQVRKYELMRKSIRDYSSRKI